MTKEGKNNELYGNKQDNMDNMLRRIVQNIQEKREKFWKEDCKTVVNFDGKRLLKK